MQPTTSHTPMSTKAADTASDDRLYTRADLLRLLPVTSDTITRWLREGRLPRPDIAPTVKSQQWRRSTLAAHGIRL